MDSDFDLSRITERDAAAEIARRMAAFRQAHNLSAHNLSAHNLSEADKLSGEAANGRPQARRAVHTSRPAGPTMPGPEMPGSTMPEPTMPGLTTPAPTTSGPGAPEPAAAAFAGAGLRASDPGHADVQTHPLFLHAHQTGQATRRRRIGARAPASLRLRDAGRADEAGLAPHALYTPAFAALLHGDADAAQGERVASVVRAPARRRPHRAAYLAAAALMLAAGGILWQLDAGDLAGDTAPGTALAAADGPITPAEAASRAPAPAMPSGAGPSGAGPSGAGPSGAGPSGAGPWDGVASTPSPAMRIAAGHAPQPTAPAASSLAPPIVAMLKPDVPAIAATERSARVMTASASGPFDPLVDLLSPLTQQFAAAGRALGGGTAGADLRQSAMGKGGEK